MKVMGFVQNEMKWRVCIVEVVESAEELNIRSSRIDLMTTSSYVLHLTFH